MKSSAYLRGYAAALRGKGVTECPFEGHTDASMTLQLRWMDGHFDASTGRGLHTKRKNLKPRRPYARVRWPKSAYVRRRLEAIFQVQTRGN